MNQTYFKPNQELLDTIAKEIAMELAKPGIIRPMPKAKKSDIVVKASKKEMYRYGVRLSQDGENMVYHYIQMIAAELRKQHVKLDDFYAMREATDLMGLYVLKEAYSKARVPFESNYEVLIQKRERNLKWKLAGLVVFALFFVVAFIGLLSQGS